MTYPDDQIAELKRIAPNLSQAEEGGHSYIRIAGFTLPSGCSPESCDLLLHPAPRDNYQSRLYFSSMITGCPSLNWNGNIRVLGQNWVAFSWETPPNLRLAQMLLVHLSGLRK